MVKHRTRRMLDVEVHIIAGVRLTADGQYVR